ncbi:hypothetical protein BCR41DRAFT_365692 [Lobosporangium transversale]|uniref:Uncharacterized protein n=1 Tax=Lobosporangium transversale TaxID=64571 RepID=A0A1Y2G6M7_9FUNG|nr:hypothetical protein BCR41DRAFT_365692 [Lobosporangium transversale]ORY93659.1 hypothetical protein BCR41DRAFT_365692 [Lobosporangium transversale]|eukprot:XP_021875154.1 hypothetical protein BCR41DRAFT_365692 [Lobosporangium transversale]
MKSLYTLEDNEDKLYKINNTQGWWFIMRAWYELKQETIRHCFHHVPIFEDRQKELLLASKTDDSDIVGALAYFRNNVLSLYQLSQEENAIMDSELQSLPSDLSQSLPSDMPQFSIVSNPTSTQHMSQTVVE